MENNVKFCATCGQQIAADATFCSQCGAAQPRVNAAPQAPAYQAPAQAAPQAPAYQAPAQAAPQAPAYQAPAQAAPQTPAYQAPAQAAPQAPAYQAPAYQAAPQAPAYQAPAYQAAPQAPAYGAPAQAPAPKKKVSIPTKAITPLIVAALALIMLITAFLPIFSVKNDEEMKGYEFNLSAINVATLMFDSFGSYEYEDLADSGIAEQMEEIREDMMDEFEDLDWDDFRNYQDLPASYRRLYNKYTFLNMRAQYKLESTKTNAGIIAAGVACIAYLIVSIVLFVSAALKLLAVLKPKEGKQETPQSKINRYFFAVPALLALAVYAIRLGFEAPAANSGAATGAVVTYLVAGLALVASVVFEFLADKQKFLANLKDKMFKVITVGASVVLAIAVLVTLSSPLLSSTVSAKFDGRSTKTDAEISLDTSYFVGNSLTDEELIAAEEMASAKQKEKESALENSFEYFEDYSVGEIKKGEADSRNARFLDYVACYDGFYTMNMVFGLIPLLCIAAFGLALHTIWANAVAIVNGEKSKKSYVVLCAALVVIAVALAFFYSIKVNGALETYKVKDYDMGITLSAILAIVFAVGIKVVEAVVGNKAAPAAPAAPQDPQFYQAPQAPQNPQYYQAPEAPQNPQYPQNPPTV